MGVKAWTTMLDHLARGSTTHSGLTLLCYLAIYGNAPQADMEPVPQLRRPLYPVLSDDRQGPPGACLTSRSRKVLLLRSLHP